MPEQEREEAVGSYSEILSNKAFVKCSQSLCPTDFHHTIQITCIHSRLDYIGMMVIGINVSLSDLSGLVVEPGGDHVKWIDHDGHHEPREERPGQVGQPGAALKAGVTTDQVINIAERIKKISTLVTIITNLTRR